MQLKRAILSVSFLLVYSLGFSHDLIPHCRDHGKSHDHKHGHEHHHHDVHDHNEDHDHISHHGHFDEGVLDLLICVLSETDHPVTEDEHCFYLPEVRNYKANSENFKFIANFICSAVMRARADDNTGASFQIAPANGYLPPPIANSPHRGPPVIS